MNTKQQRLEFVLKNAIKSGNKARAAWAIVELERLSNCDESNEIVSNESNVYCVVNADRNLAFGYFQIQQKTDKAIKINDLWIPNKGIAYEEFEGEIVIRLKHWFEEKMTKEDFRKLDRWTTVINELQIDKREGKIEVPMLITKLHDGSYLKYFFIKVSPSIVRVRKCKGLDYVVFSNTNWLSGKKEATMLYNYLIKNEHYQSSRTRFADF